MFHKLNIIIDSKLRRDMTADPALRACLGFQRCLAMAADFFHARSVVAPETKSRHYSAETKTPFHLSRAEFVIMYDRKQKNSFRLYWSEYMSDNLVSFERTAQVDFDGVVITALIC